MATNLKLTSVFPKTAWRGFKPGSWQTRVNVRDFIQRNYTPYEGDAKFLQGPTQRTRSIWQTLQPLLAKEREKGVLDVSGAFGDTRARAWLYRQGARDHRRS